MKTIDNSIVEPDMNIDSSSSLDAVESTDQETDPRWIRALKILENAEPAEVLEKPVLLCDGRWLTGEEVAEYAEALSGYPEDNWSTE
jgi:hypothetical protein